MKTKSKSCLRSQSWMTNDNENSAVFSSQQNSCSDDAARIEDGKPFQERAAATGKARSPSVTRLVDGTISAASLCRRRSKPKTCIYVGGLAEGLGKIRWCSAIKAAVHQNTQPELATSAVHGEVGLCVPTSSPRTPGVRRHT